MKRSTRLLSVFIAFAMIFTTLFSNASAMGTNSVDGRTMTAEESAKMLLDYVDAMLAEDGDILEIGKTGIQLDYRSINSTLKDVVDARDNFLVRAAIGQLSVLNTDSIRNMSRSKGNLNVIYALIQFLKDNSEKVKKGFNTIQVLPDLLTGQLDLGIAGNFIDISTLNINLSTLLNDLIYDSLMNYDGKRTDHPTFKNYNTDQLLNKALQDLLADAVPAFGDPGLSSKVNLNNLSLYSVFKNFLGVAFNELAVGPLNTDFRKTLADLCGATYNEGVVTANANTMMSFYNIIDWNYQFSAETYNFDTAYTTYGGLVGQANDLICTIFNTLLNQSAKDKLQLVKGTNDNLQANLTKLVRFILPLCPADLFYDGFDMESIKEEALESKSLEDMAVLILQAVVNGSFDYMILPKNITNLEQLAVVVGREYIAELVPQYNYDAQIFSDFSARTLATHTEAEWLDIFMTMLIDLAMWYLDQSVDIDFNYTTVMDKKAQGWTWVNFLDEIVDWALQYCSGLVAAVDTIPQSSRVRGQIDAMDPWYKLSVLLNSVLPLEFFNGIKTADNKYPCDMKKLVLDNGLKNLLNFNIKGFLDLVVENSDANNILNINGIEAVLKLLQRIVNAVLPGAIGNSNLNNFTNFTSTSNFRTILLSLLTALNNRKAVFIPKLLQIAGPLLYDSMVTTTVPDPAAIEFSVLKDYFDSINKTGDKAYGSEDFQTYKWNAFKSARSAAQNFINNKAHMSMPNLDDYLPGVNVTGEDLHTLINKAPLMKPFIYVNSFTQAEKDAKTQEVALHNQSVDSNQIPGVELAKAYNKLKSTYDSMAALPREGGIRNEYLAAEIGYANGLNIIDSNYYTPTFNVYQAAKAEADRVLALGTGGAVSQKVITETTRALQTAIVNLVPIEEAPDFTELEAVVAEAHAIFSDDLASFYNTDAEFANLLATAGLEIDGVQLFTGSIGALVGKVVSQQKVDEKVDELKALLGKYKTLASALSGNNGADVLMKSDKTLFLDKVPAGIMNNDEFNSYINILIPGSNLSFLNNPIGFGTGTVLNANLGNGYQLKLSAIVRGDVNGDGNVDVFDISLVDLAANNKKTLSDIYVMAAEMAGDEGVIDLSDYGALLALVKGS